MTDATRDRPWLMRTYSGHSSAKASNELYRRNLAKGQTGLSVAFDLPTQTGYDADHALARGEVGKVGVPISSIEDMRALFDGIPLGEMNTSMTINATAAWLLALYVAVADEHGAEEAVLAGTTQNDIIKEYLSRGTYVFPPGPSMRLTRDVVVYTVGNVPKWNPVNVCSYHLQEVGATPEQEVAFALATATAILDEVRDSGMVATSDFGDVVGRISFFVNAGIRFVTEVAKLRAFAALWDDVCRTRYGVTDPKLRRFRYGVQVNSLGLTEAQPENNIARILLEMLAVTLSKDARARAIQLPAWNEALGLPRPWDQQWSLRIQQILANETDLLDYPDIFEGSKVMDGLVAELAEGADAEMKQVAEHGGAVEAVPYMKAQLVSSNRERVAKIERGEIVVVGQNKFTETGDSPLTAAEDGGILTPDPQVERERVEALEQWKSERDQAAVEAALEQLAAAAGDESANIMPATIEAAKAGATTGEWAGVLREAFGDYRAPTGVTGAPQGSDGELLEAARAEVKQVSGQLGRPIRILVAKPGLDGHSNGAEQIAVRARDVGMEVVYQGIRLTPEEIAASAVQEDVDVVGLSILSGSHRELVPRVVELLRREGAEIPVVVGGIIPAADAAAMREAGVERVYTPKDFEINRIMGEIAELVAERNRAAQPA